MRIAVPLELRRNELVESEPEGLTGHVPGGGFTRVDIIFRAVVHAWK